MSQSTDTDKKYKHRQVPWSLSNELIDRVKAHCSKLASRPKESHWLAQAVEKVLQQEGEVRSEEL